MKQFITLLLAMTVFAATTVTVAQAPPAKDAKVKHGHVGYEVFGTSTPNGGGKLTSRGVRGKRSKWYTTTTGAALPGAVTVVLNYYHCKECRDKAVADKKAKDAKKKADAAAAKKKNDKKNGAKGGANSGGKNNGSKNGSKNGSNNGSKKKTPPKGKDVPTYDKRFWDLKNGRLVPKDDHSNCPKPDKFECGKHYDWWLKNHKHVKPAKTDDNDHSKCTKPAKFHCGAHFQWWLRNHKHKSTRTGSIGPFGSLDSDNKMASNGQSGAGSLLPAVQYQFFVSGTVIAGEPVMGTVLDADGAAVSGVVIETTDGEEIYTDQYGRFWFIAPEDVDTIVLTIAGSQVSKAIWSTSNTTHTGSGDLDFEIDDRAQTYDGNDRIIEQNETDATAERIYTPQIGQIGQTMEIEGHFPTGSILTMDGEPVHVLASSPTEMTVIIGQGVEPGTHTMELLCDGEIKALDTFDAIKLQIEPGDRTLMIGQQGQLRVRVLGTELSVMIQIDNATPQILEVCCKGEMASSGGLDNIVMIDVIALSPGAFQLKLKYRRGWQHVALKR